MFKRIFILFVSCIFLTSCTFKNENQQHINKLWSSTVQPYLQDDLWLSNNSYDAGHALLLPLYYAFESDDKAKIEEFQKMFQRFNSYLNDHDYRYEMWNLGNSQFLFLLSNYIVLCAENNQTDKIPASLLEFLNDEVFWLYHVDRKFRHTDELSTINKAVQAEKQFDDNFPIGDMYMFYFMTVFNLNRYYILMNESMDEKKEKAVKQCENVVEKIFHQGITYEDDIWIFQKGVWEGNFDFAYSAHQTIEEGMELKQLTSPTWDSSHATRWPVFLYTSIKFLEIRNEDVTYYQKLLDDLSYNFLNNIIIYPNDEKEYFTTTNFMDGRDGVYRYDYESHKGNGYLPGQLTKSVYFGWWAFLNNEKVHSLYGKIVDTFPLSERAISFYTGPSTTRVRNSYVSEPDFFNNGFAELNAILASQINLR